MTEIVFRRVLGLLIEIDEIVHDAIEIVLDELDEIRSRRA
jgi:hypothetical protein